eukprot:scaffold36275_cov154-Isochrysis_galbana.AAC.41
MPAVAKVTPTEGKSIRKTPLTRPLEHSLSWSARSAAWFAANAAEHAVSYDTHGPCRPSAKDKRPDAIDSEAPVAAYTLRAMVDCATMWEKSFSAMPTKMPLSLPVSDDMVKPAPWNAS